KGIKYAVPDVGLHKPVKGSVVFAAIKAANDAGLKVPVNGNVTPSPDRICGKHVAEYAHMLKEKGALETRFSEYLKRGLDPEKLPEHFEEVKNAILKAYGG
ncbi:MAG: 50S ribosomal protein L18, partial [Desulfurococcaceae archaeon]